MSMAVNVVVRVAVEKTAYLFDRLFDYLVPYEYVDRAFAGCRVTVPFGSGNRRRQGIIYERLELTEIGPLKPIGEVLDSTPALSDEMLLLAKWIRENCYCTYFEAARVMLPTGLNVRFVSAYKASDTIELTDLDAIDDLTAAERKVLECLVSSRAVVERDRLLEINGLSENSDIPERLVRRQLLVRTDESVRRTGDATLRMVRMVKPLPEDGSMRVTRKHRKVAEMLSQSESASMKEICYFLGVSPATVRTMERHGIVEIYEQEQYRRLEHQNLIIKNNNQIRLSGEQIIAYENLHLRYRSHTASTSLLYGVTGSGKTSVFMRLIDDVIADGRGVIVMVPEIALTPQTLELFRERYGDRIAVFHSGLSLGQRLDEWKRVKNGDADIAIGTRSAVFAPFEDVGLIVMDEEQEYTYKSESTPRFHARDVARFRTAYHKSLLVLASATPSIESYYLASEAGRYDLETLNNRYGEAVLPDVDIIDISEQRLNEHLISPQLYDALKYNLENGYQSILLHNRRGYNTFVACRACGHILTCKSCSVSMTFHHDIMKLVCHYCGCSEPFTTVCPECGAEQLRYAGQGTQRVYDELERLFPVAKILRMDADSTVSRSAYTDKLNAFSCGDYDIMVGTQMVAKGLDFERVTLVGVVLADQMLYSDDFRSYERAFSLLTQVVGRSGRGAYRGRAIIQTLTPDNAVIDMAKRQNYLEFYYNEIKMRKAMLYPPFSDICMIGCVGENESETREMAAAFLVRIKQLATGEYSGLPLRVLGPTAASVTRVKGKFRYKLIIKCRNCERFRQMMGQLLTEVSAQKRFSNVQAFIDMNPESIM